MKEHPKSIEGALDEHSKLPQGEKEEEEEEKEEEGEKGRIYNSPKGYTSSTNNSYYKLLLSIPPIYIEEH